MTRPQSKRRANARILLVARNSGQQSGNARRAVANECQHLGDDLYRHKGIDLRGKIPHPDKIVELLKDPKRSKKIQSIDFITGNTFTNEYLIIELTEEVTLLVSTGSGAKLDENLGQPFLDYLNALLRALQPEILCWHRIDRVFRTELLCANTIHICNKLGIEMVDGETGVLQGDFANFMLLLRARESAEEARRTPKKTRDGQIKGTGLEVAEGSTEYAVAMSPPAGMMALRMKAPNGHRGQGLLTFDTPKCYPDPATVAYGLPEVYRNGKRVDQVKLVRGALVRLADPNMRLKDVARWLMRRSYSTHRLRLMNTASTAFTPEHVKGDCARVVRSIRDRLEFYETGVLPVRFGVAGVPDLAITGCFPPDGLRWGAPDVFARIKRNLAATRGGGPASLGLIGVIVETEVGPLPLRKASADREKGGPGYILRPADSGMQSSIRLPALPHSLAAEWVVESLCKHADSILIPFLESEVPQDDELVEQLREAERELEIFNQRADALTASLGDVDENGKPALSSRARQRVSDQLDAFCSEFLEPAEARVASLKRDRDEAVADAVNHDPGIRDDLILRMVESLRDPYDTTFNTFWKGALRFHSVTVTRTETHGLRGTLVRYEGTIRTAGASREFVAPVEGEYVIGACSRLPELVDDALALLLQGVPFASIAQPNRRSVRLALAERLGFDSRYFGLPSCSDPRLVRIAAHLALDPHRDVVRIAADLDEPTQLVELTLANLMSGRPTWAAVTEASEGVLAA